MTMKRILTYCLFLILLPSAALRGAEPLRERVYLSTDREVYVAGEAVWLSAWCVDATSGRLSTFSKIAYVELHSPGAMVRTAKIALQDGRGAGRLFLPASLPTGNYRLIAYTALGASEEGFDPGTGARTLSVFNTFSNERIAEGVTVVSTPPQAAAFREGGPLQIETGPATANGTTSLRLANNGDEPIQFSLGVRHDDGIPAPQGQHITDFIDGLSRLPAASSFDGRSIPEYEGEIIRARVSGTDAAGLRALRFKHAFISTPGNGSNLYTESLDDEGAVTFFTSNIYGDQNMFLEIEDVDNVCHLELLSPFRNLPAGDIPALQLSEAYAPALELRSLGMQLEHHFEADTLYAALPLHEHPVFDPRESRSYILDDYTRFPVMEELFTEFITELRVRRVNGKRELQVLTTNQSGDGSFRRGNALILLDGVPVLDTEKILGYDPLLVKRIDIYPYSYLLGSRSFTGVVNFVTYQGTLPSMQFEDNVRIVDYQGCSLPLAYTCEGVDAEYPDYRQTLYWHPLLTLAPGESRIIECKTPAYSGRFEAVAEGLTQSGRSLSAHSVFTSVR